ncbi:MAG: tRNA pseudouridine(55) synthase TruB, partial [Clostridia bacterium]
SINALKKDDGIFLDVFCSKGTYIRTLCADIGKKLGCGACMDALERISVENFNVLSSHTLDELRNSNPEELAGFLIPTEKALDFFPPISLKHFFAELVRNGCAVETKKLELENIKTDCLYRLFDENLFFGVGAIEETDGIYTLKQKKFFG